MKTHILFDAAVLFMFLSVFSCANPTSPPAPSGGGAFHMPDTMMVSIPASLSDSGAASSIAMSGSGSVNRSAPLRSSMAPASGSGYQSLKTALSQGPLLLGLADLVLLPTNAVISQNHIDVQAKTDAHPTLHTGFHLALNQSIHDQIVAFLISLGLSSSTAQAIVPEVGTAISIPNFYYFSKLDAQGVKWIGIESTDQSTPPNPYSVYWTAGADVQFVINGSVTATYDAEARSSVIVLGPSSGTLSKFTLVADPDSGSHGVKVHYSSKQTSAADVTFSDFLGYADDDGGALRENIGYLGSYSNSALYAEEAFDGTGTIVQSSSYPSKISADLEVGKADSYAGSVTVFTKKTLSGEVFTANTEYFVAPQELGSAQGTPMPASLTTIEGGGLPVYNASGAAINVTDDNLGIGFCASAGLVDFYFPNHTGADSFNGFVYQFEQAEDGGNYSFAQVSGFSNHGF